MIREGDYYRIASYRENHVFDCTEVVSKDRKKAFVLYVQVLAEVNRHSRILKLQGLDPGREYDVDGVRFKGDTLMKAGYPAERMRGDVRAAVIEIRECAK